MRAVVLDFGRPLLEDVVEGVGVVEGEAHEDHVRVRVGERSKTIVVFLSGRVPQRQLHLFREGREELINED